MAEFDDLSQNTTVEKQKELGVILEAVKILFEGKQNIKELKLKDKLLRDGD
mgnify:CR=1